MADLRRKVSHLQDLALRYQTREGGREGRILAEMVDVLREIALDVEEVAASQLDLEEYVEEIDSDLLSLEEEVFEEDDEVDEFDAGDDEAEYIELECPQCELESFYNADLFDREGIQLTCPHCGNVLFDSDEDCLVMDEAE